MNSDTDAPGCRGTDETTRNYDGCLLTLALDLGRRLLPAFENEVTQREGAGKGLPYAWVNLKHGLVNGEVTETCTIFRCWTVMVRIDFSLLVLAFYRFGRRWHITIRVWFAIAS
jgi:hypothetical protein